MDDKDYILKERFRLPDNWEPEAITCMIVPIPADSQYLAMAIGLLDRLRWSTSYDRDPTKTGAATVARTWARALNSQPILFGECEVTVSTIHRVDPKRPWVTQESTDGIDWYDILIQPTWGSTVIVPDTSSDKAAQSVAETVMLGFIEQIIKLISDGVGAGESADTTVTHVVDRLMGAGAGATIRPTVQGIYDAYAGLTPTQRAEYTADDCKYALYAQHVKTAVQDDPSWLQNLSSTIVSALGAIADPLLLAFGPLGELLNPDAVWRFSGGATGTKPQPPFATGPFSPDCDIVFNAHPIRAIGPIYRTWHAPQNAENPDDTGVCIDIIAGYELVAAIVKVDIDGAPSNWYYRGIPSPSCVGGVATSFGHANFIVANGGCGVACAGAGYDLVWEQFGITDLFNIQQNNAFTAIPGPAIRSFWGGVGNQNSNPAGMTVNERWHFFVRTDA